MKLMEEWRNITGYEGLYQISNNGRVRSLDRTIVYKNGRKHCYKSVILKLQINKSGYLVVNLFRNKHLIHRLVAEAFIPNPENKPCVGHWDCNKHNNSAENLYWCTQLENINHPITRQRMSEGQGQNKKRVFQYTLNNELVKVWSSETEVGENGYKIAAISRCCKGGYFDKKRNKWHNMKQHKGYRWSHEPL